MARKSAVEKNRHRRRMVAKFSVKRTHAIANDQKLPVEERFEARLKLQLLVIHPQLVFVIGRDYRPAEEFIESIKCLVSRYGTWRLLGVSLVWSNQAGRRNLSMTMSDPLGDMLTRIRNGRKTVATVICPASKLRANVLDALQREGYIRGFSRAELKAGIQELTIELKYHEGEPVIKEISRVSTPGRRIYSRIKDLRRVYNGLGISILSTPCGVLSDSEARAKNVGGEVLCQVF